ncbi:hypothetical protein GCM10007103_30680 [Salinimicrobium marinum]|uniref:Gamma-glutamylcyclotransferase AIG2-like domain-containing protein n=1 Tax=Salinimicrobium marinum TaxID=680283 RepID=A0A918SKB6_9FLAO|nr:gamma-glutamylcyclotransferase family protein [Salinimicrobium marinum]GHA47597.1 hypothetical protein GCM10007103_30680 [Salinimicrobium marinum]
MATKNYIFGYGSLMEEESRLRTTPEAETVLPVLVDGYKRGWFGRIGCPGISTTFLGCVVDKNCSTNGVIYEVNEKEIEITDVREKGYQRVQVDSNNVTFLFKNVHSSSKIWIYINNFHISDLKQNLPCQEFPIVQSYVDICIDGCLEIEKKYPAAKEVEFAKKFITTTHYWSHFWVNDRIYPRRPFIYRPNAYDIDFLLQENLADKSLFDKIYFE